jgi:TPR repeat protein
MRLMFKYAAIFLMLSFAAPVAAGPLQDAIAVYDRDDYATALRLFRPLADQGKAEAQFNLGSMQSKGEGVSQNLAEGSGIARLQTKATPKRSPGSGSCTAKAWACRRTTLRQ